MSPRFAGPEWRATAIRTVLPVGATLALFFVALFFVALPSFEQQIAASYEQLAKEETATVHALLQSYYEQTLSGELTTEEAKRRAIERVRPLRFGKENKDYFFLSDYEHIMLMHPYRPDLEGASQEESTEMGDNYAREFVRVARAGGGYVRYTWQWQDDPTRIEPKTAYIRPFEPWDWIIGTGVYTADLKKTIATLSWRVHQTFVAILLIALLLSAYVIWQGGVAARARARVMQALCESELRYELVVSQSRQIIYEGAPDGGATHWSGAIAAVTGLPREQHERLSLADWAERVHPDDRESRQRAIDEAAASGRAFATQYRYQTQDGRQLVIEEEGRFVDDLSGAAPHILGSMRDVTEQHEAREALVLKDNIIESAAIAIATADLEGRLTYANPAFCEAWRSPDVQPLLGRPISDFWRLGQETSLVLAQLRQKHAWSSEVAATRVDGSEFDAEVSAAVVHDKRQQPVCLMFTSMDITARKRAESEQERLEQQLRQSQKMEAIGQLAGGVAHDFNNILTVILGNAELVTSDLETGDVAPEHLLSGVREIERGAQRAGSLTRQLLAFSRRQVSQPQVLNVNTLLKDMDRMLHRLVSENIEIAFDLAEDAADVCIDVGQIEQIVMNLAVNARDAMPDGGVLNVRTENVVLDGDYVEQHPDASEGPHVMLSVTDTGCGMDLATMERIFEPFFTTKPVGIGTGLGLATVYGIVRQADGHIAVESEPGVGTTFRVYLPMTTEEPEAADVAPPPISRAAGDETILVCEDDDAVRRIAVRVLRNAGYTVLEANHPQAAVSIAESYPHAIDLLLTDVIMPEMNGRQLADSVEELRPELRTLFVSGYAAAIIADHGVLDSGVALLSKPFSQNGLLRRVRSVLDRDRTPTSATAGSDFDRPTCEESG